MNVGTFLTKAACAFPGNTATVFDGTVLTYRELDGRVNRLANALRRLGVAPGDNVAILQYNRPETLEALFASFKAACGAVPINFRLHPNEYSYIINHSEAKAVICSPEFNDDLAKVRSRLPRLKHIIALSEPRADFADYETLLRNAPDAWTDVAVQPDDLAWLFYWSRAPPFGATTTGRCVHISTGGGPILVEDLKAAIRCLGRASCNCTGRAKPR